MRRPILCLAASGGGHVRQLLDLAPVWQDVDHFFVTEPTALGHSIAADHRTHFVAHVAWGQAKLGAPLRMVAAGFANARAAWRLVRAERPDIVLTTGAGSMAFTLLWARLHGARIVLIDSFARFDRPSLFARLAGWLAHERIAQSPQSAARWPGSRLFDPFRMLDAPRPAKEPLLFATVGATLPFPRLVDWVERAYRDGMLPRRVIVQVGEGGRHPAPQPGDGVDAFDVRETIGFGEVQAILGVADIVVCHGGTGSLITALRAGCHVITIPREFARGEHYDDHQSEIASTFADRGLIAMARDEREFRAAIAGAAAREVRMATTDPAALIAFLNDWIAGVRAGGR